MIGPISSSCCCRFICLLFVLLLPCSSVAFLSTAERRSDKSNLIRRCWSQNAKVVGNEIICRTPDDDTIHHQQYDLSSPREWLEYCEAKAGGKGGAYTVLRCDYRVRQDVFSIWGKEFHLQRLVDSFPSIDLDTGTFPSLLFETSKDVSDDIILSLLDASKSAFYEVPSSLELPMTSNDDNFFTVMVTILWEKDTKGIQVSGHAFSTLNLVTASLLPDPVSAVVSLQTKNGQTLPNRFENSPQSKLSSWCRRRRPIEQIFKTSAAVGEVILTKKDESSPSSTTTVLLEGLTSNIFVLYPGNVLRTPDTDCVLGGYARFLVLESAKRCGLDVEIGPIPLDDAPLWKEVFLTSSIRLVIPIQEILLPIKSTSSSTTTTSTNQKQGRLWQDTSEALDNTLISKQLLADILNFKGYK